jgi:glycosyltransferase involved in cell wall biosynthesis
MLKVAAFTGGLNASPARFRVRQYVQLLEDQGIRLREYPAPLSAWPPRQRLSRPIWALASLASRLPGLIASHWHDVVILQQSLLSTYYTLEPLAARPRILDLDDAIWSFSPRKRFIEKLARNCDLVICGNDFLAERISSWNSNITVIPTGVNIERFRPGKSRSDNAFVVGWSGGSGGFKYLYGIESALQQFLAIRPEATLLIVADKRPDFRVIPPEKVKFLTWSPENEVASIQSMDVGIMPIDDSVSSLGKCSYKMLLYMACAKPVVVSPYGMNADVLTAGDVGFGARSKSEWVDCLNMLARNRDAGEAMGRVGREVVESHFDVVRMAGLIAKHIREVA